MPQTLAGGKVNVSVIFVTGSLEQLVAQKVWKVALALSGAEICNQSPDDQQSFFLADVDQQSGILFSRI